MFSAGVLRPLRARHFLAGQAGEESIPHSHPYRVELISRSRGLDEHGFSTDIAAMEAALERAIEEIDDLLLNDLPWFREREPSLEYLAVYLVERLRKLLDERGSAPEEPLEIRIWENETAWAGYVEGS